jgi:hypothetical protein
MLATVGKALLAMLMRLATQEFLEDILIWVAEKAAAHTDSKVDDELVAKIKEHLDA